MVFLCLGRTKTKENQTNTELQAFISEPQTFGQSFEVVEACFVCMNFTYDIKPKSVGKMVDFETLTLGICRVLSSGGGGREKFPPKKFFLKKLKSISNTDLI